VVDAQCPDCHGANYKIARQIKHLACINSFILNALDFLKHALSFALPALAVAVLVALGGRWLLPKTAPRPAWWSLLAINSLAGLAAMAAGLWYFGRDGKMASYAAMVLAVATAQWLAGRAWRG
jgi:hypothetical protein